MRDVVKLSGDRFRAGVCTVLLCVSIFGTPQAGLAAAPGDFCGVVRTAGGTTPVATDAFLILRAAVSNINCAACDVDNSGVVNATDALNVLKVAVNLPGATITCPSWTKTPCTQSGLESAISTLNAASSPRPILPESHLVFDCEGTPLSPQVIKLDETWASPALTTDRVMIAGTGGEIF